MTEGAARLLYSSELPHDKETPIQNNSNTSRRELLGALGAGMSVGLAAASLATPASAEDAPLTIVDFYNHYAGPSRTLTTLERLPPGAHAAWERINANLQSPAALIGSIAAAGISARVINIPTAFLEDADGKVPPSTERRINDQVAELVDKNPGKLHGLATVNAFTGDAGAQELSRAVRELKLRGVFLESAKGDLLLGDKPTHPTLAAAAQLCVPVFMHPQTDPQLHQRFSRTGPLGMRFARGTINSAALVSLLESGVLDENPKLQVEVTTLAFGGLMLAGGFGDGARIRSDAPALTRRHVYIDTMGLNPAELRAAVDLLGADHVLTGTDWPIAVETSVPERLRAAFAHAGLTPAEQQAIASGNVLRLIGGA